VSFREVRAWPGGRRHQSMLPMAGA
jgi:hypothetical protein